MNICTVHAWMHAKHGRMRCYRIPESQQLTRAGSQHPPSAGKGLPDRRIGECAVHDRDFVGGRGLVQA